MTREALTYKDGLSKKLWMGDDPDAEGWMEKALAENSLGLVWFVSDSNFIERRLHPRAQAILKNLNLAK